MKQKFIMRKLLCLIVLVAVTATVSQAGEALVNSSEYEGFPDGVPGVIEVGFRFKTGSVAPTVAQLGFIDVSNDFDQTFNQDGLLSDVTVSLWLDSDESLVAQVVVPAGTGAQLRDNFRYALIDGGAITLDPNTDYVISFSGDILDHYLQAGTQVTLNTYFVGENDPTTWECRWGAMGEMPISTSSWMPTYTYGCCNMQSPDDGAHDNEPETGAVYVGDVNGAAIDVTLKWNTGLDPGDYSQPNPNITKHYLYVAENEDDLVPGDGDLTIEETISAGSPTEPNVEFLAGGLDFNTLYYWRVDESVSDSSPADFNDTVLGMVWSFTTKHTAPEILDEPDDLLLTDGENATFTVAARSISALHYQWYKSDDAIVDGGDSTVGTNSDTYTIASVTQASNEAWYYVVLTNASAFSDTSLPAHIWFEGEIGRWKLNNDLTDSSGGYAYNGMWDEAWDPCTAHQGANGFDPCAIEGSHSAKFYGDPNAYVTIAGSNDYFDNYVAGLTASCWVKFKDVVGWEGIMAKQSRVRNDVIGEPWQGWTFSHNGGLLSFNVRNARVDLAGPVQLDDDIWHMLTGIYDPAGDAGKLYIDGQLVAEVNDLTPENVKKCPGDRLVIGAQDPNEGIARIKDQIYPPYPSYPFTGLIDDVRIFTYPMTGVEVAQMYFEHLPNANAICIDGDYPSTDLNADCRIDLADFAELAKFWLDCNLYPASHCDQ